MPRFYTPWKKIQVIKEYWYETVIVSLLLIWTSILQFLWISCRLFKFQLLLVVITYTLAFQIQSICSQCTLYLPPENIRKPYVLLFPGGRERVNWEQMCVKIPEEFHAPVFKFFVVVNLTVLKFIIFIFNFSQVSRRKLLPIFSNNSLCALHNDLPKFY